MSIHFGHIFTQVRNDIENVVKVPIAAVEITRHDYGQNLGRSLSQSWKGANDLAYRGLQINPVTGPFMEANRDLQAAGRDSSNTTLQRLASYDATLTNYPIGTGAALLAGEESGFFGYLVSSAGAIASGIISGAVSALSKAAGSVLGTDLAKELGLTPGNASGGGGGSAGADGYEAPAYPAQQNDHALTLALVAIGALTLLVMIQKKS